MGKYRKRFNEKARAGMLAKQLTLKKARNKQFTRGEPDNKKPAGQEGDLFHHQSDSNSEILKPLTNEEKEERKRKIQESLYSENEKEKKMSRAKRKRLDKFIEHQVKREEKKVLLEKLAQSRIDSDLLVSSKLLGTGKQTRREEMMEALELEKRGLGNDQTRDILYEEREVRDWENEDKSDSEGMEVLETRGNETQDSDVPKSSFIDNRPAKFGGSGSGFGFANLPQVGNNRGQTRKKYSWRLRVEQQDKRSKKREDEDDFVDSSTENSGEEEGSSENESGSSDEEVTGMNGTKVSKNSGNLHGDNYESLNTSEEEDEDEDDEEEVVEKEETDTESGSDEVSSDSSVEESGEDDDLPRILENKPKHTKFGETFKSWAEQEVRKLEGRETAHELPELPQDIKEKYSKPLVRESDLENLSDEENYIPTNENLLRTAFHVDVERPNEVQELRMRLPVFAEEYKIMEAVFHHDSIIVCGETGSGKTTQIPQFLYEAGFGSSKSDLYPGMIGITQPRRLAAVSMAMRVGKELGNHGHRVAHQIRFDTSVKDEGKENGTAMKFMTDGVLLREMMTDFLLNKYSVIIIDEAHERNINTDILIGMLSRIIKLRKDKHLKDPKNFMPLKLIIMSATLKVTDFSENKLLFNKLPVILKIEARQYPVSVHFNKRTNYDYLEEAFKKASKIHSRLPPGGILIFLTGQNEITTVVKRLRKKYSYKGHRDKNLKQFEEREGPMVRVSSQVDAEVEDIDLSVQKVTVPEDEMEDFSTDEEEGEDEEEEGFEETLEPHQSEDDPLYVLPLYSLLPTKEQMKVFQDPPKGSRLCVVATNVAETSLTIPGIRYVIDCGRSKERKFDEENGVQSFEIDWISKASADQRAGRAGRTGPGHCYRLYSSAIYENYFPQFSTPEILRMPVDSVVLTMKSMGIDEIINFPFPTPPDRFALEKSETTLEILGALSQSLRTISDLGKLMATFPLSPRFSKILIVGNQMDCLHYIIAFVSAVTVGDPFIDEFELGINEVTETSNSGNEDAEAEADSEDEHEKLKKQQIKKDFHKSRALFSKLDPHCDAFKLISAVCAFDHVSKKNQEKFLKENFLRPKAMEEIMKLRKQITNIVAQLTSEQSIASSNDTTKTDKLGIPNKKQVVALKQMISSGFIDQVAIRGDLASADIKITNRLNISRIPYFALAPPKAAGNNRSELYIHPSSIIANSSDLPPPYLVYHTLSSKESKGRAKEPRTRLKPLVDVTGKQLANIAKGSTLISYSKPLTAPYGPKNISLTKRECYVVPRFGALIGDGGVGFDLPVIKVTQVKKAGNWVIESK